jgi:hypothetical protein
MVVCHSQTARLYRKAHPIETRVSLLAPSFWRGEK